MTRRLLLAAALALLILFPTLFLVHAQTTPTISIEFTGTVQSANATALVINGQLIDISGAQVSAALVAGQVVRVQASMAAVGSLIAREVDPVAPGLLPGLVEMNGSIDQIDGGALLINGLRVSIVGAQVDVPLNVGAIVIVYAEQTAPNEWTARLIMADIAPVATADVFPVQTPEVLPPGATPEVIAPVSTPEVIAPASTPEVEDGEDFEVRGRLDGFTDAEVIVDGRRYFIGGAEIDGRLVPGAQVRLEIRVVNGQWVLEEIKVEDSGSDDDRGGNSGSSGSGSSDDRSSNSGSVSSGSGGENSGSGGSSGRGGGDDD
jgi:uncharacterized membrane protein YgcG